MGNKPKHKDYRPALSQALKLLETESAVWFTWPGHRAKTPVRLELIAIPADGVEPLYIADVVFVWKSRFGYGSFCAKDGGYLTVERWLDHRPGPGMLRGTVDARAIVVSTHDR